MTQQDRANCICSGYHDDNWVNPNCPVHSPAAAPSEPQPPAATPTAKWIVFTADSHYEFVGENAPPRLEGETGRTFMRVAPKKGLEPRYRATLTTLLRESLPFIKSNPDQYREELAKRIDLALAGEPHLTTFPRPCGLCPGQIESKEDLDWHGLGNCVDICTRCNGSGQESPAATPTKEARALPMPAKEQVGPEPGVGTCDRCHGTRVTVRVETGFAGETEQLCGNCVSEEFSQLEEKVDAAAAPSEPQPQEPDFDAIIDNWWNTSNTKDLSRLKSAINYAWLKREKK